MKYRKSNAPVAGIFATAGRVGGLPAQPGFTLVAGSGS